MIPKAVEVANRRIALLIATDTYADPEFTNLRTPTRDATALSDLLADPQVGAFTVHTLADRPAQEVRQVLDETFTDAGRDDLVLLHLSGHGLKDESGRLHLIMSDTSRRHLRASAIAASWLRELIDHTAARRVVVWLDCCFSGAFPSGHKGAETVDAIDQLAGSGRGCAVMTASTKVQYAFEKDASVFTEAIMAGLRTGAADLNEDGLVDAGELYSFVYDWVRQHAPGQTPTRNDVLAGDIYIAYNQNALRLPVELPLEIRQLLRSSEQRFRQLGMRELTALAEAGDEIARTALATLGVDPTGEHPDPAPRRPAVVVELPPRVAESLGTEPAPGYEQIHELEVTTTGLDSRTFGVTCLVFDPLRQDALWVASRHTVHHVDVRTGDAVSPSREHRGRVEALAVSAEAGLLVSATDLEIRWWRLGTNDPLPMPVEKGAYSLAFRPGGGQLASAGASDIVLWNQGGPTAVIKDAHAHRVRGLVYSPGGSMLASASYDHTVRLWSPSTQQLLHEFTGHGSPVLSVAFSPDGRVLASSGADNTVRLWTVASGEPAGTIELSARAQSIAFSPDGRFLAGGDEQGAVWLLDSWRHWRSRTTLDQQDSDVVSVVFSSTGSLAGAHRSGEIKVWRPARDR